VGGKRGFLTQLLEKFPKKFKNYHEPFLGGGVVFFEPEFRIDVINLKSEFQRDNVCVILP
jgi:DNA adenine methylase